MAVGLESKVSVTRRHSRRVSLVVMWQYLRKTVLNPVAVTLTVAIVLYVLVPQIIRAREEARHAQCTNRLFQHSGWHPSDIAQLDRNFNVIGVGSCPVCSDRKCELAFVIVDNGTVVRYLEDSQSVPASAIQDAERRLRIYRQVPRYREIRESFRTLANE